MRLSILMPALVGRDWEPLVLELERQADASGHDVEVLVECDARQRSSGQKRQTLVARSRGDYLCFVDDDDWVSPDYVASLCAGAKAGVDVVTFEMAIESLGRCTDRWKLGLQQDNLLGGTMAANHLCAWRRDLATAVGWCPDLGYADDQLWYGPLHASKLPRTEMHFPLPLYEYRYCPVATSNQQPEHIRRSRAYFGPAGLRCYWHDGQIVVEAGVAANRRRDMGVLVFRPDGSLQRVPRNEMTRFHSAQVK